MPHSTHAGECSRSNELGRQLLVVQLVCAERISEYRSRLRSPQKKVVSSTRR
jgi:hypothetical protein